MGEEIKSQLDRGESPPAEAEELVEAERDLAPCRVEAAALKRVTPVRPHGPALLRG